MSTPTAIYRLYDTGHQLLYVGISSDPPQRLQRHEARASWWHLVASIEVGPWMASFMDAYGMEREVQRGEYPLYNAGWTPSGARTPAAVYDDSETMSAIAAHVRDGLHSGRLRPGINLRARSLADQFKCSPITAVFAMYDLERDLVVRDQGAGRYRMLSDADRESIRAQRARWAEPKPVVSIPANYSLD